MKLADLLPSADLMDKIEGLEDGLKRRRQVRYGSKWGALLALLTAAGAIAPYVPKALVEGIGALNGTAKAVATAGVLLAVLLVGLAVVTKHWLAISRQAVRYTCSVGQFTPVPAGPEDPPAGIQKQMLWLPHDLARHLSERVGRLMFFFSGEGASPPGDKDMQKDTGAGPGRGTDQHIHIEGVYHLEQPSTPGGACEVVVIPRVRIGGPERAQQIATPVRYQVMPCPQLTREQYEELMEQVYFHVVSQVYLQIEADVERKIDLLPTRRHKAAAYYREADDYARSNTLAAYERASRLYLQAASHFRPLDPLVNPRPAKPPGRFWRTFGLAAACAQARRLRRRLLLRAFPRLARYELLAVKAKLGYANMLMFRALLSQLLGRRPVPVYEARRFAADALAAVQRVPEWVPNRDDCLFNAHVTSALGWALLRQYGKAWDHLELARACHPREATTSAVFLLASSQLPAEPQERYEKLVCAVERDRNFEIAQFCMALEREMRWRSLPEPTRAHTEAEMVIEGYREVLRLNPNNVGAAANAAFVLWALRGPDEDRRKKRLDKALTLLHRALHYNQISPETVVVEHHYDLARIHAEEGQFDEAYRHLLLAEDGRRAHRGTHAVDPAPYFFDSVGKDLRTRFNVYRRVVLRRAGEQSGTAGGQAIRAVCAFVLDEYGQACAAHHAASGKGRWLASAAKCFEASQKLDPGYVLSAVHLADHSSWQRAIELLEDVMRRDTSWLATTLTLAVRKAAGSSGLRGDAGLLRAWARELEDLEQKEQDAKQRAERQRTADRLVKDDQGPQAQDAPAEAETGSATSRGRIASLRLQIAGYLRLYEEDESSAELPGFSHITAARNLAAKLNARARSVDEQLRNVARKSLPHKWLWRPGADPAFNPACLADPRYKREAKWEREFDSAQVEALYHWASTLLSGKWGELGSALWMHIRHTFEPGRLDLLAHEQALAKGRRRKRLRIEAGQLVEQWLSGPLDRNFLHELDRLSLKLPMRALEKVAARASRCGVRLDRVLVPLEQKWLNEANEKLRNQDLTEAARLCRKAMEVAPLRGETAIAAGRLCALLFATEKWSEAEQVLRDMLLAGCPVLPAPGDPCREEAEEFLLRHAKARMRLKLSCERHLRSGGDGFASDAVLELLRLAAAPQIRPPEYLNFRTPLAIEWDDRLVPEDAEKFVVEVAAPRSRRRIEERFGVNIPGIRFRGKAGELPAGQYRILDHDVVVEEGTAAGHCPASSDAFEAEWQAPLLFTLERLEAYVERNLAQWVGLEEATALIDRHVRQSYQEAAPVDAPVDAGDLSVVLRSLLFERVPIRPFSVIHDICASMFAAGERPDAVTRAIRRHRDFRPQLWGNKPEYRRFILPDSLEQELWNACESVEGFTVLVLPARRREEVVSTITAELGRAALPSLTVKRVLLRPLIRRLLAAALPEVPVLAQEELTWQVRAMECTEIPLARSEQELAS